MSQVPPITGLVEMLVGAEGSAPFHPVAVPPTLDSHVGVHLQRAYAASLLGQPLGATNCVNGLAVCQDDLNRAQ